MDYTSTVAYGSHSRLQYGISIREGTHKHFVEKLRKTQNKILQIIRPTNKNITDSSFPIYQHLKVLPVQHLFVFKVLRIFYQ